jgi:UDP-galactopyranose mutase
MISPEHGEAVPSYTPAPHDDDRAIVCLSHLRWNFVWQRPQQLMTRFARDRRVFFLEEPVFDATSGEWMEMRTVSPTLHVAVPHLASGLSRPEIEAGYRRLLDRLLATNGIETFVLWYWTPMFLPVTRHLEPDTVVYDCMDELSGFAGAPPELIALENELLRRADVVFTGGHSLYKAKAERHGNIHRFPSSVDVAHFSRARSSDAEPPDQQEIPHPRLGYFGVIDERMDLALVEGVAKRRPDWHWVLIGPTAKIDPASLPQAPNIHYLGMQSYDSLPDYLSGWEVAVLPFAHNDATRFISPTKTPEYLAAGCAVVSTSIEDVVRPYGERGLVHIADDVDAFVTAAEAAMREDRAARLRDVDRFLEAESWEAVVRDMDTLITQAAEHGITSPAAVSTQRSSGNVISAPLFGGASDKPL